MALKEEIFEQNATLFQILDENEVTEVGAISIRVNNLSQEVQDNKLQLDGLALRVDNNQARNEQMFVQINTQLVADRTDIETTQTNIVNLRSRLDDLNVAVATLESNTEDRFTDVYQRITTANNNISAVSNEVETLADNVDTLISDFESVQDEISELQDNIRSAETNISALETRVTALEARGPSGADNVVWGNTTYKIRLYSMGPPQNIFTVDIVFNTILVEYGYSYSITTEYPGSTNLTVVRPFSGSNDLSYNDIPVTLGMTVLVSGTLGIAPGFAVTVTNAAAIIYYKR